MDDGSAWTVTEVAAPSGSPAVGRKAACRFAFVLLPDFSLMALTATLEPLRHANHELGRDHYGWSLHSVDGTAVASSSGVRVTPDAGLATVDPQANLIICGGPQVTRHVSRPLIGFIRRAARHAPMLGGLCTAARVLAEAGVLDGYRATIHWESVDGLRETFPRIDIRDSLFEFDRERMTCAGETSGIDMMVTWLAARHGQGLASKVAAQLLHSRVRSASEPQSPPQLRYATRNPLLLRAIDLMSQHVEEPLDIMDIALRLGCSRRQIERIFSHQMKCSPVAFYRNLRLDRARQLLSETRLGCMAVATACGFLSATSFSKAYRQRFGVTPHKDRGIPRLGGHDAMRLHAPGRLEARAN